MENKMTEELSSNVKCWASDIDEKVVSQINNVSRLPFVHKHIAVMADAHLGYGAVVGSVIPTIGAIIPAAVGVDIGCGMVAVKINIAASDLPDNLKKVRLAIEESVPHGRTDSGGKADKGAWSVIPPEIGFLFKDIHMGLQKIGEAHPKVLKGNVNIARHLGTLGTGNHFIEICLDENQEVWIMLHSGSRGIGNRIGSYFISLAKKEMERFFINLPDKDLAYLPQGTKYYNDYLHAVSWAQGYAKLNRNIMLDAVISAVSKSLNRDVRVHEKAINCHHNYVSQERHYGKDVMVTRKGAIKAGVGDLGIIPGSMGTNSYIVEGLGNRESFNSCSHGAGRVMSRNQARKNFNLDDLIAQTSGVECRKDIEIIDEIPGAYKDIEQVMNAQKSLIKIRHTLKQIVNVKG